MNKFIQNNYLFDFYGNLLTDKQRLAFAAYYQDDLSFQEIAENMNSTRQAVRDLLMRTERIMLDYEEKLRLLQEHSVIMKSVEFIEKDLDKLDSFHENESVVKNIRKNLLELKKLV